MPQSKVFIRIRERSSATRTLHTTNLLLHVQVMNDEHALTSLVNTYAPINFIRHITIIVRRKVESTYFCGRLHSTHDRIHSLNDKNTERRVVPSILCMH